MHYRDIKRELANSITHGLGLLLAIVAVPVVLAMAVKKGGAAPIIGASIYGITVLMTFLSSTLYHSIQQQTVKQVLRVIDHISIYFMIAGGYTPFIVIFINQGVGWAMLAILWTLAGLGTLFKIFSAHRFNELSTILYVVMGWMAIFFINPVTAHIPAVCLYWLLAGGILYTIGVVFYMWHSLLYHHAIWHVFVIAGSIFHYIALLYSVA